MVHTLGMLLALAAHLSLAGGATAADATSSTANVLGGQVSSEEVDCLWRKTPATTIQAIARAETGPELLRAIGDWGPSNDEFSLMAEQCGLSPGSKLVPGEAASLAIGATALQLWTVQRLTQLGYSEAELIQSWDVVTLEGRDALALHWTRMKEPRPEIAERGLVSVMNSLRPTSRSAADAMGLYVYSRAILEALRPTGQ